MDGGRLWRRQRLWRRHRSHPLWRYRYRSGKSRKRREARAESTRQNHAEEIREGHRRPDGPGIAARTEAELIMGKPNGKPNGSGGIAAGSNGAAPVTFLEAIKQAMFEEMERDPAVVLIGEDVGVYG